MKYGWFDTTISRGGIFAVLSNWFNDVFGRLTTFSSCNISWGSRNGSQSQFHGALCTVCIRGLSMWSAINVLWIGLDRSTEFENFFAFPKGFADSESSMGFDIWCWWQWFPTLWTFLAHSRPSFVSARHRKNAVLTIIYVCSSLFGLLIISRSFLIDDCWILRMIFSSEIHLIDCIIWWIIHSFYVKQRTMSSNINVSHFHHALWRTLESQSTFNDQYWPCFDSFAGTNIHSHSLNLLFSYWTEVESLRHLSS